MLAGSLKNPLGEMSTKPAVTLTHWKRDPDDLVFQKPLDFQTLRRMFRHARPFAALRNWLVVLTLLRSMQLPALAWGIGAIIDGPVARGDYPGVIAGACGFLLLAALTQLTFHFRMRLALEFGERVADHLRVQIFEHLQRLPLSFYNSTKLGRIISRMTSDVENVRIGVQDVLFVSTVGLGQMTVALILMLWIDWVLALVIAAMAPILWLLNGHFGQKLGLDYRKVQESFSRMTSTLAESVNGIRVTQGFVRQEVNLQVFQGLADDHASNNRQASRTFGILLPLLEFNSQFFLAALLLVGGYRVLQPESQVTAGNLVQFFFLANVFFGPIQILGNMYNQALTSMAGAERVFKLLDTKPAWEDPPGAPALPRLQGQVQFEDVTFAYTPGRPVLHNIELTAEAGQTVALVGHTGSGKSSIINLIAKFYLPTSGRVLVDGLDTAEHQTDSLHRQLGIVLQQNFLFTGTVLENIRIGRPGATDQECLAAAEALGCCDLLEQLPEGFQSEVGERGTNLSLGQRQLVCFVRALLADPRILILDEATSSVDTLTEVQIQQALSRLLAGRTAFVIAHRLSTVRDADMILVLDHGRILERGTHDELVAAQGIYHGLYQQFVRSGQAE